MPTVCVISFSKLSRDARVRRQITALRDAGWEVTAVGEDDPNIQGVASHPVGARWVGGRKEKARVASLLLCRRFDVVYESFSQTQKLHAFLASRTFDVIIANDLDPLPAALANANSAKVLLDAHEYTPREFESDWQWRLFWQRYKTHLCQQTLGRLDGMMTATPGLAQAYRENFGVDPTVVMNAPYLLDLSPTAVGEEKIRLVHAGGVLKERRLEWMVEAVGRLDDRFTLDLYLVPPTGGLSYWSKLQKIIARTPRVVLHAPLDPNGVIPTLNTYDVGVYMLPPSSFNCVHALPNKFFDFIQARLALVVSPTHSMAELTRKYSCGLVCPNSTSGSLESTLRELTPEKIALFKQAAHRAATELNYNTEKSKVTTLVAKSAGLSEVNL